MLTKVLTARVQIIDYLPTYLATTSTQRNQQAMKCTTIIKFLYIKNRHTSLIAKKYILEQYSQKYKLYALTAIVSCLLKAGPDEHYTHWGGA